MRHTDALDADIAATEAKLRALHDRRRQVVRGNIEKIVADFDRGMNVAKIAKARQLGYSVVRSILFRSGRTSKGRTAIRRQLASVAHQPTSQAPP